MLSREEIKVLRCKILEYKPQFESNRGCGCIPKGLDLYYQYNGGILLWIEELSKIDLNDISIEHLYFFPPGSSDTDIALNLGENGFPQYPPLDKREALEIGVSKDPGPIRGNFFFSIARL